MKLLRYGAPGSERPAMLDDQGRIRDLSAHLPDIDGSALTPASLARLRDIPVDTLPLVEGQPRIGACVGRVGKLVCSGLNYADHAAESNMEVPSEPLLFMKATSALCGAYDDILRPPGAEKLDWEIELAIVIGSRAKRVTESEALSHVAGYCVINDVSERSYQLERGGQWMKGKSSDTFAPLGPWLVTADEVGSPNALDLWLDVDDVRRQTGNTRTMVFPVATLVSYVSHFMTLEPGDVIATGTPPGVGMGIKPEPVYLKDGQWIRAGIRGLGEQHQRVVSA
ncbi:MAG: fumarylacetoacetate hydrolase family protein [Aquabacterium sp.]|uniref:fumarylacetoacetate hydrolase family protein n=1 Tax=Aquabacterium sp. TaxID=1872578 RepID=UPI002A35F725|nr:fumarylacetoacetate hydrolase family protein [Aquabacterium sp.]MDX9843947.1 fumarylacetoacetate hydrolase family protein [Aquabacterium sp.]